MKKKGLKRNKTVSLGENFDKIIDGSMSARRFKNASEIIGAGLRLLEEEEENHIKLLRNALQEGLNSGITTNF